MVEENKKEKTEGRETWYPAQPEELPELTFWPIVLAVGVAFFFWGFITSFIISGVGLAVMGTALYGWIEEFSNER